MKKGGKDPPQYVNRAEVEQVTSTDNRQQNLSQTSHPTLVRQLRNKPYFLRKFKTFLFSQGSNRKPPDWKHAKLDYN